MKQQTLDHYVKTYRMIKGLTQQDVAAIVGYKNSSLISEIENDGDIAMFDLAISLIYILDVPASTLYAGKIMKIKNRIKRNAKKRLSKMYPPRYSSSKSYHQRYEAIKSLVNSK